MTVEVGSAEYFTLFPHVQLVRGAKGTAIHDLFRSRVFWFRDEPVAEALTRMARGEPREEAALAAGISGDALDRYLTVLTKLDLGTRVAQLTASHAFRPHLTRAQAKERSVFQPDGTVTIEIATECVFHCPWCTTANFLTKQACSCGVWLARGVRLSPDERIFAIERLKEQGKSKLIVRGGEPLLHWDELLLILEAASRLGMFSEIHSTGVLLNKERIEALRGKQVRFSLLLAAPTESEFDVAVGRRGAWTEVRNVIGLLRQSGISFLAKIPLSIASPERANKLAEWALGLGAAGVEWVVYAPPPGEGFDVADLRAAVSPSSPQDMAVGLQQFLENAQCQSCFANTCFIAVDGLVTPCIGLREPLARLGEVRMTQVLHEDLLGSPQESTARWQVPQCARCEFRFGCWSCLVRTIEFREVACARHWDCNYDPETATWGDLSAQRRLTATHDGSRKDHTSSLEPLEGPQHG